MLSRLPLVRKERSTLPEQSQLVGFLKCIPRGQGVIHLKVQEPTKEVSGNEVGEPLATEG